VIEFHALIAAAVATLKAGGVEPILVGGVALNLHGSPRVTRDVDFVVNRDTAWENVLAALYKSGFCLITRLNDDGSARRFVREESIARLKVRAENPDSLFFWQPEERFRLDVLVDFPMPASEIRRRAAATEIAGVTVFVAAREDLKIMKARAIADRNKSGDREDYLFLGGTEEEIAEIRRKARL